MAALLVRQSQLSTPANTAAFEAAIEAAGGVNQVRGFSVDGDVGWVLIDAVVPPPVPMGQNAMRKTKPKGKRKRK